jgi:hypothetical protein
MVVEDLSKTGTDNVRSFDVSTTFSVQPVDGVPASAPGIMKRLVSNPPPQDAPKPLQNHPKDDSKLGPVLGKFVGTFRHVYLS